MTEEFIAPAWSVEVGDSSLVKVLSIDVWSHRDEPMDLAKVTFDPRLVDRATFIQGAAVHIGLGYLEHGIWPVFSGEIVNVAWQAEASLLLHDGMEALKRTRIRQTFVDASPQEIVSYGLAAAGVGDSVLGQSQLPRRHLFVAQNLTVLQLLRQVNRSWGLEWPYFCDASGRFFWCAWPETGRGQGRPYVLEYGQNVFDLTPPDRTGRGRLVTVMLPAVRHSDVVRIVDPRYWGQTVSARIERVHHHLDKWKARTTLAWTLV